MAATMKGLTERQRRTASRPLVASFPCPVQALLTSLTGMRTDALAQIVREGRVTVDGCVASSLEEPVLGPDVEVAVSFAGLGAQTVRAGAAGVARIGFRVPQRPPVSNVDGDGFLAEVLASRWHGFLLGVDAAVRALVADAAESGIPGGFIVVATRSSFHRKIVHCVAARWAVASLSLKGSDADHESGWWEYDHCVCCVGPMAHEHQWEGWHGQRHVPVRVAVVPGVAYSVAHPPPPLISLAGRRGFHHASSSSSSSTTPDISPASDLASESASELAGSAGFLSELPDELLVEILSYLDVPGLVAVSETCLRLCRVARDNALWHDLFLFFVARDNRDAPAYTAARKTTRARRDPLAWFHAYRDAFTSGAILHIPGSGASVARDGAWTLLAPSVRASRIASHTYDRFCSVTPIHYADTPADAQADFS